LKYSPYTGLLIFDGITKRLPDWREAAWKYDPWTGGLRAEYEVKRDPYGREIWHEAEWGPREGAAQFNPQALASAASALIKAAEAKGDGITDDTGALQAGAFISRGAALANKIDVRQEHYRKLAEAGAEPFEVLRAWLTPEEYRGYMKGSAIVYLARERLKNGDDDIGKAVHHLQRLLQTGKADV
jgi:hypothetical protein